MGDRDAYHIIRGPRAGWIQNYLNYYWTRHWIMKTGTENILFSIFVRSATPNDHLYVVRVALSVQYRTAHFYRLFAYTHRCYFRFRKENRLFLQRHGKDNRPDEVIERHERKKKFVVNTCWLFVCCPFSPSPTIWRTNFRPSVICYSQGGWRNERNGCVFSVEGCVHYVVPFPSICIFNEYLRFCFVLCSNVLLELLRLLCWLTIDASNPHLA